MWPSTPVTLTILVLTMTPLSLSQSLKNFGESCSGDCDERLGLICSSLSNICECMLPNATIYDDTLSHCVTKAGSPCRRIISTLTSTPSPLTNLCVPHASCPGLNLPCECHRDYFQTRNGTCAPTSKYGEPCSSRRPCDKSNGIECSGSKSKQFTCTCKYPRDQYYSQESGQCISYPGGNCSTICVKNAKCSIPIFEVRRGETPSGKSYQYNATVGKKCGCDEGYTATQSRQCLPSHQASCGGGNDNIGNGGDVCNPEENLKCFDNKICLCRAPLHQVYSKEGKKCLNLVGAGCQSSSSEGDCVEGAECQDENENGICRCKTGFSVTDSRNCLKDFGKACSSGDCNLFKGLSCQNGTCGCVDEILKYSSSTQSCRGGQGSPCGEWGLTENSSGKEIQFMAETEMERGKSNYPPPESGQKFFKKMTIECDSGLRCEKRDGYQQCV